MTRLALALALSMLATPACAAQPSLVIRDDPGGSVAARVVQIADLQAAGTRVEIRGFCASACTMLLGMACVAPGARLGFHGPQSQYPGVALPPAEFDRMSGIMAEHYPGPIRDWFLRRARLTTMGLHTITGTEAVRLGARACK